MPNPPANEIKFRRTGGVCVAEISGVIDETFDGKKLVEQLDGVAVIDLDKVIRITSFGVREWMTALRNIPAEYCCFVNVRPAIVAQFNMVGGFAGRGQLLRFYASYLCRACDREVDRLIDLRHEYEAIKAFTIPAMTCPVCGGEAEFDDIPESYLAYVAAAQPPSPPPSVEALLEGASPASATQWKVEKEVEGTVTAIWLSGPLDKRSNLKRLADGLEGDVVVLLGGIGTVTDEGVQLFRRFTESAESSLLLAQMPAKLAAWILADAAVLGKARIASYRFSYHCEKCKRPADVDLDETDVELEAVGIHHNCVSCGYTLVPDVGVPEGPALATLKMETPSEPIREYLQSHRQGPGRMKPGGDEDPDVWGKYHLNKQIGAGGMAQVFLARLIGPEGFEKKVVLKRIQPHLSTDPVFVAMFLEEARLAARLSHPNIVQIFDLGMIRGQYYIAMEYVRGWDLHTILRVCKQMKVRMPVQFACRIIADICGGLAAAHASVDEEGARITIVHRDVSPQNILISLEGMMKLTDFGIAKAQDSITTTEPGQIRGKTSYMSPEQVKGTETDGRADIFAAGCVLWECLAGKTLFERDNPAATLMAVMDDPVPALAKFRPEPLTKLDEILSHALDRVVDRRFATATEFQAELEIFLASYGKPNSTANLASWLKGFLQSAAEAGTLELPPTFSRSGSTNELTLMKNRPKAAPEVEVKTPPAPTRGPKG